jgi:peptidoglycan/xylan/chitin deacetylase (PgdA/CDA1 family)
MIARTDLGSVPGPGRRQAENNSFVPARSARLPAALVRCAYCLAAGLGRVAGVGGGLAVLTYHRVIPGNDFRPAPTWNVTPRQLRAQLRGLLARGCRPWPLLRALAHVASGARIPGRVFVVTFDDGFENTYTHAWPILRELGVPATVFLATAYLDSQEPFPFDDWPAAGAAHVPPESWRPLTTEQCREMLAGGLVELGSHTHTHANFRGRPEAFAQDLEVSLEVLRSRFRLSGVPFSFPFGIQDAELVAAARRSGVLCALTTQADLVRSGGDPFTWGRFGVGEDDTPATIALRLDGWYSLARQVWLRLFRPMLDRAWGRSRPRLNG